MLRRALVLLIACLVASAALAQDSTREPTGTALPVFPLRPGTSVEGNLSDATPNLRYRFDASAGDVVSIQMDTTSGSLDPFLMLMGPDGELIGQNDDGGGGRNAAITTTLSSTGAYTIDATRYVRAPGSGTFRLALTIAGLSGGSPTDPLATVPDFNLTPDPGLIAYQEPGVGALNSPDEAQYFAFGGQRGDLVRVILSATGGDLVPQVDVLNRDQVSIASSSVQTRPTEAIAYATLPETGWYLVRAGAQSGAGDYTLYLERITAGAILAYGDSLTGQFSPDTPSLSYIFNARAGDLVAANLFATEETSGVQPELRLLDLGFQTLARGGGSRFATLRADIPRSGTYLLQVANLSQQAAGGYNVRLTGVPLDVSKLEVTPLAYNQRLTGMIEDGAPLRYYRFSGKAGELVTIEMAASGGLDPFLILSDGNLDEELTFNDNTGATRDARIVRYRLDKDGDYLITASRAGLANGTTAGGFDLALTAGDIALTSGILTATLSWNSPADLNLFVRDPSGRVVSWSNPAVPGGGQLQIDSNTGCQTPSDEPIEYIYWPQDRPMPGDYEIWAWYQAPCAANAPVDFSLGVTVGNQVIMPPDAAPITLQPGQRFQMRVRLAEDGAGYLLEPGAITHPTPQQATSEGGDTLITYGDALEGQIDDQVYARFYQFRGTAGDQITLSAETLDGDLDPILILRGDDDQTLPSGLNDDAAADTRDAGLSYTLPYTGQYVVAITRYGLRDGTTGGAFRLTLERAN